MDHRTKKMIHHDLLGEVNVENTVGGERSHHGCGFGELQQDNWPNDIEHVVFLSSN